MNKIHKLDSDEDPKKSLQEQVNPNDPSAQRVAQRIDNAKTVEAIPVAPLPSKVEPPVQDPKDKKHPHIDGPVEVTDPELNDNRKNAEEAVKLEHGDDIANKGNFEELVQKKLLQL